MILSKVKHLRGELAVPGDKSISHRAVMFASLAKGKSEITNFLKGADCLSTISCFQRLGITVTDAHGKIIVEGKGLHGLTEPAGALDVGNSGTTIRLLSGILAAQPFSTALTGDASIRKRPMKRIIEPLSRMGASITCPDNNGCAPLLINGSPLRGIHYRSPVASAQVKSAVLLAGLYAEGETSVIEPSLSRDHSEIMLRRFGADVRSEGNTASIQPFPSLEGCRIQVPGDISSAAYFIVAALLVPGSEILIQNTGINPTRSGILKVLGAMGADIELLNIRYESEPCADILVRSSSLSGTVIEGSLIPTLIDEIPVIAVAAAFADGATVIRDAAELRVKESDRIAVITENLSAMGCRIEATKNGMVIHGGRPLRGAVIDPHADHRIAMSFAIAALAAEGHTQILDSSCVSISYPDFFETLNSLTG